MTHIYHFPYKCNIYENPYIGNTWVSKDQPSGGIPEGTAKGAKAKADHAQERTSGIVGNSYTALRE